MLGLGVGDLLRWSTDAISTTRIMVASVGAGLITGAVAGLSGFEPLGVVVVAVSVLFVVGSWLSWDQPRVRRRLGPGYPLALVAILLAGTIGASGSIDAVAGDLDRWYSGLAFPAARSVSADQFVLGASATVFLLATSNQIVRLVLEAAGTPAAAGETTLKGGRLLGPLERLLVAAMLVAGDLAGAGAVVAAKGLIRLPEIRTRAQEAAGTTDTVTEYFLIGTFTSLAIAAATAGLVLAAG